MASTIAQSPGGEAYPAEVQSAHAAAGHSAVTVGAARGGAGGHTVSHTAAAQAVSGASTGTRHALSAHATAAHAVVAAHAVAAHAAAHTPLAHAPVATAIHRTSVPGPSFAQELQMWAANWQPVIGILFFVALICIFVAHAEGDAAREAAAHQAHLRTVGHVQGHRRRRRREGGAAGDRRVPARPQVLPRARGEGAEGNPPARAAGHGQDAAREGRRERVRRAVLRAVGGVVRGDVRGPRRRAHPPAVRDRAQARTGDHLHRRARRRRRPPRHGHLRREGPDAQPAAGGDGRLRLERAGGGDRRLEPARQARPRAAAPGTLRPPGVRRAPRRQRPYRRARSAHARQADGATSTCRWSPSRRAA